MSTIEDRQYTVLKKHLLARQCPQRVNVYINIGYSVLNYDGVMLKQNYKAGHRAYERAKQENRQTDL
jgi:hypothetical protein